MNYPSNHNEVFGMTGRWLALAVIGIILAGCDGSIPSVLSQWSNGTVEADADADWNAAADRAPTAKSLYGLARIMTAQGKDPEASMVLSRIIYEYPDFMPAYIEMAEIHSRHRKTDLAIEALQAGLIRRPGDAVLLNNIGICLMLKGDLDDATEKFSQATAAMPDNARYRANLALSLGMQGRYDESLAVYKQVLGEADAHQNLAIICKSRNDLESAKEHQAIAQSIREADEMLKNGGKPAKTDKKTE